MNWTEQEYADYQKRRQDGPGGRRQVMTGMGTNPLPPEMRAAPSRPTPGRMNKTEAAYGHLLEAQKRAGQIKDYRFEAVKLRLANTTFYTPDFMVVRYDGSICFVEIKGFWRDDARVKIKVAAEQYRCFSFVAVRKCKASQGGGWAEEAFRPSS